MCARLRTQNTNQHFRINLITRKRNDPATSSGDGPISKLNEFRLISHDSKEVEHEPVSSNRDKIRIAGPKLKTCTKYLKLRLPIKATCSNEVKSKNEELYVSMVKTITAVQQECKIERAKITQKVSSDKDENNKSYNP